jgi:hypothetical protein
MTTPRFHRVSELWIDPSSGDLSASRLVFLVVNLVFLPALVVGSVYCAPLSFGDVVKLILGLNAAPAVVYGINSASGAWNRKSAERVE